MLEILDGERRLFLFVFHEEEGVFKKRRLIKEFVVLFRSVFLEEDMSCFSLLNSGFEAGQQTLKFRLLTGKL